jgi:hypothetical protein
MTNLLCVLALSALSCCFPLVAQEAVIKKCGPTKSTVPFQVAYAHHFTESNGKTLSLRVSVGPQHKRTTGLLYRVGCAVAAKYEQEERWHLLIFSEYKGAESYAPPDSEHSEPAEYIGACMGIRDAGEAQVKCGVW